MFNIPLALDLGLVGTGPHPYSLHVGGCDIIGQVPVESIAITEAGPGGVSSMSFTIDDPDSTFAFVDGAEVRMWDYTRDLPMFWGWVEHPDYEMWAAVGRTIHVSAFGIESLLDTVVMPTLVLDNDGTPAFVHGIDTGNFIWTTAVLQVLAGFTGLRAGADGRPDMATSTDYGPSSLLGPVSGIPSVMSGMAGATFGFDLQQNTVSVDLTGQTVRGALETWRASASTDPVFGVTVGAPGPYFLSVDFWGGVRFFGFGGGSTTYLPSDYATLTIDNSATGVLTCSGLKWSVDTSPGAIVSAVYVKGAAAASTGWVVGDTTTGRREASATTTGTGAIDKAAAAGAVMGQRSTSAGRGTLTLEDYTPTNVHPGSQLVITDSRMGWSSKVMLVTQIDKTMVPGTAYQNWTVSFIDGGDTPTSGPPSAMRHVRALTRGTLQ